jgi:protein-disulfide isomerase
MLRRFLVALVRRSLFILILICLGCSAQSAPSDTTRTIERQVRGFYNIPPSVKILVGPTKPSDFQNYDALVITFDGGEKKQTYDFLLSKDGKTLIRMTKFDLTKDPYTETMKKIDVNGRPTRGNKDAKVVVVNYDDFECPFCSRMHATLFPEILKEYGDRVLFIYKDYPLKEIHPWATHAAVDANCLAAQNNDAYWGFADYIHSNQREVNGAKGMDGQYEAIDKIALLQGQKNNLDVVKLQACVKAQDDRAVKVSENEADSLGVSATPTMYVNGEKVDGALTAQEVRDLFDRALRQAGQPVPDHAISAPSGAGAASPAPAK